MNEGFKDVRHHSKLPLTQTFSKRFYSSSILANCLFSPLQTFVNLFRYSTRFLTIMDDFLCFATRVVVLAPRYF